MTRSDMGAPSLVDTIVTGCATGASGEARNQATEAAALLGRLAPQRIADLIAAASYTLRTAPITGADPDLYQAIRDTGDAMRELRCFRWAEVAAASAPRYSEAMNETATNRRTVSEHYAELVSAKHEVAEALNLLDQGKGSKWVGAARDRLLDAAADIEDELGDLINRIDPMNLARLFRALHDEDDALDEFTCSGVRAAWRALNEAGL